MPYLKRNRRAQTEQSKSLSELPWYLSVNNIEKIWRIDAVGKGKGSLVTIYDSCAEVTHPGFSGRVATYEKCTLDTTSELSRIHGTIVAGVITATNRLYYAKKAETEDSPLGEIRVAGAAPEARVLVIDRGSAVSEPVLLSKNLQKIAIKQFNERGYKIKLFSEQNFINYSGSGNAISWTADSLEGNPCNIIADTNIIVIAAIGNNANQINTKGRSKVFPASLNNPKCINHVLRVAGTDYYDETMAPTKFKGIKYGKDYTDIYTPAQRIPTLIPKTKDFLAQYPVQGTSEAAPLVASALALMSVCHTAATPQQLRDALLMNSDKEDSLDEVPLLNIYKAVMNFCRVEPSGSDSPLTPDEL